MPNLSMFEIRDSDRARRSAFKLLEALQALGGRHFLSSMRQNANNAAPISVPHVRRCSRYPSQISDQRPLRNLKMLKSRVVEKWLCSLVDVDVRATEAA